MINEERTPAALIIGGGSKLGLEFTSQLASANYDVTVISGSDQVVSGTIHQKVNWGDITFEDLYCDGNVPEWLRTSYDIIIFNQNPKGPSLDSDNIHELSGKIDNWDRAMFNGVYLPYIVISILREYMTPSTKVCFILSGIIDDQNKNMWKWPVYAGTKSSILHLMRYFSQHLTGTYVAVNPYKLSTETYCDDAEQILSLLSTIDSTHNGKYLGKDGCVIK